MPYQNIDLLNNKIFSSVIHAEYEGSDIADQIHIPRFCNDLLMINLY